MAKPVAFDKDTPRVHLNDIVKDYGRLRALDHVSFSVGPGITGLLGPNGAGKSTLIKVLLGLVSYSSGTGDVLGFDLAKYPREIRSRVGYMPEDDCYISGLTGIEMVQFSARLASLPSVEALRRSHEILDFCGLQQERYRKVETYSTGMRQKLKFAQAIVHSPPLLILDEPTSGLDPEERQAMLNRIRILANRFDKSVVISTHILPDVQAICDHVVILARGTVQVATSMEELSRSSSAAYELRIIGDSHRFAECVRREGLKVQLREDGRILISGGGGGDMTKRVYEWAQQSQVVVRSLLPSRTSLEQFFLDAVRGDHHARA